LIEMAASADVYSPERSADITSEIELPDLADFKAGAKFLVADASYMAESGQEEAAWERLGQAVRLGELVHQEANMVNGLVSLSIFRIAARQSEVLATQWRDRPENLQKLRSTVTEFDIPSDLVRQSLKGEFLFGLDVARNVGLVDFRASKSNGGFPIASKADRRLIQKDGPPSDLLETIVAAPILRFHVAALELARDESLSPSEFSRGLEELQAKSRASNALANMVFEATTPVYQGAGESAERAAAEKAAFSAYIDLLIKTPPGQAFPKTLSGVPTSKSGKPLFKYEKTGAGFALIPDGLVWSEPQKARPVDQRPGVLVYPRPYGRFAFE
jgi:hypothetical protein